MDYDSLIKENEWLIYSLIKKYPNYNKEDLYQAGIIGIIKAYKKYNSNIGIKFSTYAYKYILGEIIKCISEQRNIQVSEDYISISKRYLQVKKLLTDKYNREATFKEICEFMQMDESALISILESVLFTKSIDDSMYNYGNDIRNEIDTKILLESEINSLDEFDRSIILCRYYADKTQSETAEVMGISQVKVSRQEKLILSKMKKDLCI